MTLASRISEMAIQTSTVGLKQSTYKGFPAAQDRSLAYRTRRHWGFAARVVNAALTFILTTTRPISPHRLIKGALHLTLIIITGCSQNIVSTGGGAVDRSSVEKAYRSLRLREEELSAMRALLASQTEAMASNSGATLDRTIRLLAAVQELISWATHDAGSTAASEDSRHVAGNQALLLQADPRLLYAKFVRERDTYLRELVAADRERFELFLLLYARYATANIGKAVEATRVRDGSSGEQSTSRLTPLALSLVNPQAPFYIPGTAETGLMRLALRTSSRGEDRCHLEFVDHTSSSSSLRDSIQLSRAELIVLQHGLVKLQQWAKKASEEKVRKIFSKTAACFPIANCGQPSSGGFARIEFQIYEDGSTSGRILVFKGRYRQPYNFSLESAKNLLSHTKVAVSTLSTRSK